MIIGREVKGKEFWISHYNERGEVTIEKIPLKGEELYEWVPSDTKTETKTWNNSYIKKSPIPFGRNITWKFRLAELTYSMPQYYKDKVEEYNKPIVTYLDIENYVNEKNEFTEPSLAEFAINVISMVTGDNIVVLTTLENLENEKLAKMESEVNDYFKKFNSTFKISFNYYKSEKDLLYDFAYKYLPKIHCLSGWNVIEYDWQYISNRCEKIGIDLFANLKSRTKSGRYGLPMHIGVIDYMEAFENIKPYKDIENSKLTTVAERAIGATKLHNPYGNFGDFMKDTFMFIKYNIIDSCLIRYIENEILVLDSSFALCKISEVELCNIFSSVYVTEMLLCKKFYNRGIYLPRVKKKDVSNEKKKYKGAFVKAPIPGYYENVVCFDFNSMYPNIAIEFNISPETYMGYADEIDLDSIPSYTITAKNTVFRTDKRSATGEVLIEYYDRRKSIKKEMEAKKKILYDKEKEKEKC